MKSGIYQIKNVVNNKIYVGSTQYLEKRWQQHQWELNNQQHKNRHLQAAWNKYGSDAFVFDTLEEQVEVDQLFTREQHWINELKVTNRKFGYNVQLIANSPRGVKRSPETRAKMSAAQKGKKRTEEQCRAASDRQKGKPVPWLQTPEARAKSAANQRGKQFSEETKARMSAAAKKRCENPEHLRRLAEINKGKKQSPETIAKRSDSMREVYSNWTDEQRREHGKKCTEKLKGRKRPPEVIAKMSAAMKGKPSPMKGTKQTPEQREKNRQSHIGIPNKHKGEPLSAETKAKLSATMKGRKLSEERKAKLRGRKLSEEHKAKISAGLFRHYKNEPDVDE